MALKVASAWHAVGMRRLLLGTVVLTLGLAACSQAAPPAPVVPSPTPTSASPTATPTPTPTPTPTLVVVNPLTGLPPAGGVVSNRPALMVKIDDVGGALPQTGLPKADIVVEQPMEGGLTRFMAIFQSQEPGIVGPIRSARPVDAQITRMLGPTILLFSGASPYEIAPVKADSHALLIADDWSTAPGTFERHSDKSGEHNLYGDTAKAWKFGLAHGAKTGPPNAPLTFTPAVAPGATPVKEVSLDFGDTRVRWDWDSKAGVWLRSQNGREHDDAEKGQLNADTVLVISVPVRYDSSIHDVLGTPTPLPTTTGAGTAWLYRDGTGTKVTWSRPAVDDPFVLTDASGAKVGVKPGRTWIELLDAPRKPQTS